MIDQTIYGDGTYVDPYGDPYANYYDQPAPTPMPGPVVQDPAPAPDPTQPTPTPPTTPSTTAYSDAAFQQILRKYPPTVDGLAQAVAEANKTFGTSMSVVSAGNKVMLPNGTVQDVIVGAHSGNPTWGWSAAGGTSTLPGDIAGMGSIDPSYLAPFEEPVPNPGQIPEFQAPGPFQVPDANSIYADPSYQFRLNQGAQALQNSAAAKGVLNSGGTLQDILNYGQGAASQEYSNIYDRAFGKWNADWNNALTQFRSAKDVSDDAYSRAMQRYTTARDTFYANQTNPFDKLYKSASLGATAAAA